MYKNFRNRKNNLTIEASFRISHINCFSLSKNIKCKFKFNIYKIIVVFYGCKCAANQQRWIQKKSNSHSYITLLYMSCVMCRRQLTSWQGDSDQQEKQQYCCKLHICLAESVTERICFQNINMCFYMSDKPVTVHL